MSTRGSKRKNDEGQSSSTPIQPAFPDLREKYKTVEKLEEHLKKLDKATLQSLILNGAFPEAKSNLRHCVYCHKTFDKGSNDDDECAVEHFQELQGRSKKLDEYFPCCGKIMDNADVYGDEMRAEEMEPCCYQGVHWEREITTDDEKEFDDEYLGMVYEDGEKLPVTWWREWKKHGNSCEKVGCASRATKIRR